MREYYVGSIRDRDWGMLMLEFKLFAVRHPKLRARIAATVRRMCASKDLEAVNEIFGLKSRPTESKRAVMEALIAALVLEHSFDPDRLSEKEAADYLGGSV